MLSLEALSGYEGYVVCCTFCFGVVVVVGGGFASLSIFTPPYLFFLFSIFILSGKRASSGHSCFLFCNKMICDDELEEAAGCMMKTLYVTLFKNDITLAYLLLLL